jgi:hypothetical protein
MTRWHLQPDGSYTRWLEDWYMNVFDCGGWWWCAYNPKKNMIVDAEICIDYPTPHAAKCAAMRACKEAEHG